MSNYREHPKPCIVSARVTPANYEILKNLAAKEGKKLGSLVSRILEEYAAKHK